MRCLHVLDALDDRGAVRALVQLLRLAALESAADPTPVAHDVLTIAGGALEADVRAHARRVTTAATGLDLTAAVLTGDYDVVHALDRRLARRLAPLLTSRTAAAFIYSAPAIERAAHGRVDTSERAILAACDLVVLPPDGSSAPGLSAAMVHRAVCLDLARLAEPAPLAADGGPAFDLSLSELRFVVREWAAALGSAHQRVSPDTWAATVHP
jgi:hypothetical protein